MMYPILQQYLASVFPWSRTVLFSTSQYTLWGIRHVSPRINANFLVLLNLGLNLCIGSARYAPPTYKLSPKTSKPRFWASGLIAIFVITGLSSCAQPQQPESSPASPSDGLEQSDMLPETDIAEPDNNDVPELNPQLLHANTRFSFDLFSSIHETRNDENVLISPMSVAMALAMVQSGASGETQQAIATTLRIPETDLGTANAFHAALLKHFQAFQPEGGDESDAEGENIQLAIANSLWGRDGIAFKASFLDHVQETFNAEISTLDFATPDAPNVINQWVSEKTQGHIPQIIDTINPDDVLFLINAIYFKGSWSMAFDPEQTIDRPFTLLDGTEVQLPLMTQTAQFQYLENETFQAVQLPYGENKRFRMVIWLPSQENNWTDFLATLTADGWNTWQSQFVAQQGMVQLPKFTLDDTMSLNSALRSLGMAIAFDPNQADFSHLSDTPTLISQVNHRTFMDVTEAGTEAAATTSIGVSVTSVQTPVEPFEMVVDRPFTLGIYDSETSIFLFLGSVVNPS